MGNTFGCYKINKLDAVTLSPTSDGTDPFTNFELSDKEYAESANQSARESNKPDLTTGKQEIVIASKTKSPVDQMAPLDSNEGVTFDEESGHV
ncbi:hypothetical protein KXD40_003543 [Peronospora effusa]|uniref:Uncharacterized protein n=1 Tax=Peronospora effusa TaxID=542832 RepID=A0A3M6VUA2_9STRA|nr:hypothetical protein DD238_001795 [Peronospora effusa]RQM10903.1 hypothetical protein DD237_006082 [Peronospora effusa]UIZ22647.1 hypothetical protein KXD40_003543 [Peronospora effusa]CAI5725136.1 unnamed protein product [Peronospora effusa]